jgi:triacylglycerol lipase
MILLIIFIITLLILGVIAYLLYRGSQAFEYTVYNSLHCGKDLCDKEINNNLNLNLNQITDIKLYNKDIALYVADLINRVYLKKDTDKLIKIRELYIKENPDIFGIIWKDNDNNLFIIFRGTQNIAEWIKDSHTSQNIFTKSIKNTNYQLRLYNTQNSPQIHAGFLEIYYEIKKDINNIITQTKPNKIIIAGHSLGAGLSVICGLDLSDLNVVVYNFGCPRVGDENFVNYINQQNLTIFRHANSSDVITTIPPAVSPNYSEYNNPYFYKHCGILKSFDTNWKSLTNNHSVNCYINAIKNNLIT